jgi:two-component system, NtrC family, nitrogen regulation response regulator NtrX
MSQHRILIIDDEASIRASLQGILEDEGYAVTTAASGEEGLEKLPTQSFGLVLLDIWLPGMDGLDVLRHIRTLDDRPQVVVISGHGTVETAVKATKLGAFDFLEKPLTLEKVVLTVKNSLRQRKLEEENLRLREQVKSRYHLVGKSAILLRLRDEIKKAAPTDGRVLLTGENGTGKELIARLIHDQSRRRDKRFVELNCAAVPDELIENEIFGYLKGSAPHAVKDKRGKLLLADGGTLFLDEVGDMSLKTQAKLVKALIEQTFEPLGSSDPVSFDARIIAASTRSLKDLIVKGRFREDLFFKLNVIPMAIPPLRERTEDIPLLIAYFLRYFASVYGKKAKTMSNDALKAFLNYSWPGNVSELMNVMERFVILVEDEEIGVAHLNLLVETREHEAGAGLQIQAPLVPALEQFERTHIRRSLLRNKWDAARAAVELDMDKDALLARIKALHVTLNE